MTENLRPLSVPDSHADKDLEKQYALPRNELEGQRLDIQHGFFTEVVGRRLILDQGVKLGPGDRVLDSGTGTGAWIIALSEQVPKTVELIGTDISSSMFQAQVPDNVHLLEASSTDLPREWTDTFSLINQRLLLAALTIPLWRSVLSELFRVLKPGGVIQLMEAGEFGLTNEESPIPTSRIAMDIAVAAVSKRDLLGFRSGLVLPGMLKEAGFSDIRCKVYEAPLGRSWGEIGVTGAKCIEGALRAFEKILIAEGGLGLYDSRSEVDRVIDQTTKEWNETSGVFIDFYTITARKYL